MSLCECGERLQRLPDGSMPDKCYRCLGGTRELRRRDRPLPPAAPVEAAEAVPLTEDERAEGLAGLRKARQALATDRRGRSSRRR